MSRDIRLIVHRSDTSLLLCYVAHHDPAYMWAERRKLETHPRTGAAQLVKIRERVQEITVPKYVEVAVAKPLLFASLPDTELLEYGVPPEWLADVRNANQDKLLAIAGRYEVIGGAALPLHSCIVHDSPTRPSRASHQEPTSYRGPASG